jgi:hypothetical protein
MVNYLCDLIESIIDQICQRVPSIPITIRAFCKAIQDKNNDAQLSHEMMAKFVIEDWLAKVAFKELVTHGLLKSYYIRTNADANIQLMGLVLNRLFLPNSPPFEEDVLMPFNTL